MPIIQYTAQLDFTDNGTFETGWRIKQGDYGESEIILRVVNNGVDMYDADITPEIVFRRADGASVISTMTPNDGTYKYTFVGNELAVPGSTLVDVKYTDSESRISTASCRFTVIEDTIGYDPTGAHTYDNPVSELVETATAAAETSINSAFIAEGYAVGTQGGEPVGRTSEYYHNNSKFYRDEASALADAFTSKAVETETGSFKSLTGGKLESCIVDIEPIQDLHGYNNPWIGGSGKNKLQNTRTGTTEQHGLKITSNEDGSVLFHAGYTANAVSAYDLSTTQDIPNGSYILNGCPSGGGGSTFQLSVNDKADTGLSNTFNDFGSGVNVTISNGGVYRPRIVIRQGYTIPEGGLLFKPMLRLSTESSATFERYSNICPITGHSSIDVDFYGKNFYDGSDVEKTASDPYVEVTLTHPIPSGDIYYLSAIAENELLTIPQFLIRGYDSNGVKQVETVLPNVRGGRSSCPFMPFGSNDIVKLRFYGGGHATISTNEVTFKDICIEKSGYQDYVYEPFVSKSENYGLGGTYYNGTLDVVSGVGSTDEPLIDLGDLTWNGKDSSDRFYAEINDIKPNATGDYTTGLIMCSAMKIDASVITSASSASDFTIAKFTDSGLKRIYVKCSSISSASDFKTAVTGIKLLYQKATASSFSTTPHQIDNLVGMNNIVIPYAGQSLDSVIYRGVFAWDDVMDVINAALNS